MSRRRKRTYGEGSIDQLPSGRFRARARVAAGRVSRVFDTEQEAKSFLRELLNGEGAGRGEPAQSPPSPGITVGDWSDQWLAERRGAVAPKTYDHDESRVRRIIRPTLGREPLRELTPHNLHAWLVRLAEHGYSSSERQKAGKVLRKILSAAVAVGLLESSPFARIRLPKVERPEKTALTREQALALATAARPHRLAAYVVLGLDTGARPGELFALHWDDFDPDAGTVFLHRTLEEISGRHRLKEPKTRASRRRLPVAPETVAALESHRRRMESEGRDVCRGIVFCSEAGGFLRASNFLRYFWVPTVKRAGIPRIRPYDLRHTCATLLLRAGVEPKVVAERLGHTGVDTLLACYAHALPDSQERVVGTLSALFGSRIGSRSPETKSAVTGLSPERPRDKVVRGEQAPVAQEEEQRSSEP